MKGIKILGSSGSRSQESFSTCIQVTKNSIIDAGNLLEGLGEKALHVNNIFVSHSHLDHIVDIAFLLDNHLSLREEPLVIHALPKTIAALKEHLFNWQIWPDFSQINLLKTKKPSLEFREIAYGNIYEIEEGVTLEPIESNHSVPTCGYIISKEGESILYTSDTYLNDDIWLLCNRRDDINAVIVDVSFPSALDNVARNSKHLTPKLLKEQSRILERNVNIYVNHFKHIYKNELKSELEVLLGMDEKSMLKDGDVVLFEGSLRRGSVDTLSKVQRLNGIGIALSAESNIDKLLEMIVSQAKSITGADGGTLYIKEGDTLRFQVVQTDTLGIKMGGTSEQISWNPLPLYLEDGKANKQMVAATCALEDRIVNIADVYEAEGFSFEGTKVFDKSTGYRSKSMLVIPLRDHEHKVIGVLQLINKQDMFNDTIEEFSEDDEHITLSLASQAAVAINNITLINDLEKLLEAFLKSIIYAIEKKSLYTAGHITRMVKLSVMIARAINNDTTKYKEKNFSHDELKQINFAALMHDIGKLSIPEQVVDKATKLEAIFDRVELVKSRIALISKEAEIAYLKKEIDKDKFDSVLDELARYENVIVQSNEGLGFTSDEEVELFKELSEKEYFFNAHSYKVLTEDEAYNLCIRKGTLTQEQRDIINEHAQISLDILNKLPFPKKYKEIPQISANHHEKINGMGYPQGLKGEEISFEARILAIADIFEALTASDRPYKKANPLSAAMKILYYMAKDNDLDAGLVRFFYESGLYMEYAEGYLPPELIDEVGVDFSTL